MVETAAERINLLARHPTLIPIASNPPTHAAAVYPVFFAEASGEVCFFALDDEAVDYDGGQRD
jgi:hypothetical protein